MKKIEKIDKAVDKKANKAKADKPSSPDLSAKLEHVNKGFKSVSGRKSPPAKRNVLLFHSPEEVGGKPTSNGKKVVQNDTK